MIGETHALLQFEAGRNLDVGPGSFWGVCFHVRVEKQRQRTTKTAVGSGWPGAKISAVQDVGSGVRVYDWAVDVLSHHFDNFLILLDEHVAVTFANSGSQDLTPRILILFLLIL